MQYELQYKFTITEWNNSSPGQNNIKKDSALKSALNKENGNFVKY